LNLFVCQPIDLFESRKGIEAVEIRGRGVTRHPLWIFHYLSYLDPDNPPLAIFDEEIRRFRGFDFNQRLAGDVFVALDEEIEVEAFGSFLLKFTVTARRFSQ